MRWFKNKSTQAPEPEVTEAAEAVTAAETCLEEAQSRRCRVDKVVGALNEQIQRNHFGDLIEATMRGTG